MTEETIIRWIMERLEKNSYVQPSDLAKEFFEEHQIMRTNDPVFKQFMNASLHLADQIALKI